MELGLSPTRDPDPRSLDRHDLSKGDDSVGEIAPVVSGWTNRELDVDRRVQSRHGHVVDLTGRLGPDLHDRGGRAVD